MVDKNAQLIDLIDRFVKALREYTMLWGTETVVGGGLLWVMNSNSMLEILKRFGPEKSKLIEFDSSDASIASILGVEVMALEYMPDNVVVLAGKLYQSYSLDTEAQAIKLQDDLVGGKPYTIHINLESESKPWLPAESQPEVIRQWKSFYNLHRVFWDYIKGNKNG